MADDSDIDFKNAERRLQTMAQLEAYIVEYTDHHIEKVENRISTWIRRGLIAFALIGLSCVAGLLGLGYALDKIQDARREFVETSCSAQNERHDKAIVKFRIATAKSVKRTPQFKKEIEAGGKDTEYIIDALAPKQDCDLLAKVALGEADPPPPSMTNKEDP